MTEFSQTPPSGILSRALEAAKKGYNIIPIQRGEKACKLSGWQNQATRDPSQIQEWFGPGKEYENGNYGITGKNVLVLDLDVCKESDENGRIIQSDGRDDWKTICEDLKLDPEAYPWILTGGGGTHIYFKRPTIEIISQTKIEYQGKKTLIDIRVGNAYVIGPGSLHKSGNYYEGELPAIDELPDVPAKLLAILPKRNEPTPKEATLFNSMDNPVEIDPSLDRRIRRYIEAMDNSISGQGGHNALLNMIRVLMIGFDLTREQARPYIDWINQTKCDPAWGDKEIVHKIEDVEKYKQTVPERGKLLDWQPDQKTTTYQDLIQRNADAIDRQATEEAEEAEELRYEEYRPRPFPLDALPNTAPKRLIKAVEDCSHFPAAFTAPFFLSLYSSIYGAAVNHRFLDWKEPTNIYSAVIADSGAGKSPSLAFILPPFDSIQKKLYTDYQKKLDRYKLDLEIWKNNKEGNPPEPPTRKKIYLSDATPEAVCKVLEENPYGVAYLRDELSSLIGGMGRYNGGNNAAEMALLNEAWKAGNIDIDRKGSNSIFITRVSISITGGIQPKILKRIINKNPQLFETGLLPRFLFSFRDELQSREDKEKIDEDIIRAYHSFIEWSYEFRKSAWTPDNPLTLTPAPEAVEYIKEIDRQYIDKSNDSTGMIKTFYPKLKSYFVRIAAILHLMDNTYPSNNENQKKIPNEINLQIYQSSKKIIDWFENEIIRLFNYLYGEERDANVGDYRSLIIERLTALPGQTPRDLARKIRTLGKEKGGSEIINKYLDLLIKEGKVRREKGKRSFKYYIIK